MGDTTLVVGPHRDGLDIDKGHLIAHLGQFLWRKPGILGVGSDVAHLRKGTTCVNGQSWPENDEGPGACAPGPVDGEDQPAEILATWANAFVRMEPLKAA